MNDKFEVLKGSFENLDKVPVKAGQLIFTTDKGRVFLDVDDSNRKEVVGNINVIKLDGANANSVEINGTIYKSLTEALENSKAGDTVKLIGDCGDPISLSNQDIILDLNACDIKNNDATPLAIAADASLTIQGKGTIECNANGKASIENNGNCSINNGNVVRSLDGYYTVVNHGNMTISNAIVSSATNSSSMIENGYQNFSSSNERTGYVEGINQEQPTLTVTGGTYISDFYIIKNDDNGKVTIEDGTFLGSLYNVGAEMTINGGYFKVTDGSFNIGVQKYDESMNAGATYINGGTFEVNSDSNIKVKGKAGAIVIKGGKFNQPVPNEYLAAGYKQEQNDGYYEIKKEGE